MKQIDIYGRAVRQIAHDPETVAFLGKVASEVAKKSRENVVLAYPSSLRIRKLSRAIDLDFGVDEYGAWADVGYTSTNPGFVLWWSEVGTQSMSARPHLRAALDQVRF